MKLKLLSAMALLLLAIPAKGQTTPPKDPFEGAWNVSVNGGYSNISNQQTNNGFVTGISFRVAQHWCVRSDIYVVTNPGVTVALGGAEYRFSLEHLIKSSSTYAANASRLEAFLNAEAGTTRQTALIGTGPGKDIAKFAYALGGGFDIKLSDTVTVRPLDLKYVRSSMLANSGQVLGNHLQFSAGLGMRF